MTPTDSDQVRTNFHARLHLGQRFLFAKHEIRNFAIRFFWMDRAVSMICNVDSRYELVWELECLFF